MSSLRYFSLHNINLESSLSFLHPDNTIGNELNGLPTFFSLLSDSNAPCVVILGSTFPCEHCCASPHLCLARFSNVRPVCVVFPLDYVQWRYGQLCFTISHFPCTGLLKTMSVFGFCGSKNECVLHNWSHPKATGGGCARPAACPACEQVQVPLAHSHAGLGTHCPQLHVRSAVFFLSVLGMGNFSWEPKTTAPSDLFSVPCLRNTSSHSR